MNRAAKKEETKYSKRRLGLNFSNMILRGLKNFGTTFGHVPVDDSETGEQHHIRNHVVGGFFVNKTFS